MSDSVRELLSRVDRALHDYGNAEQTTIRVRELSGLEEDLQTLLGSLRRAAAGFAVLDRINAPADRPEISVQAAGCRTAAQQVRTDRSAPPNLSRALKPVSNVAHDAAETVANAWKGFVDSCMPGLEGLDSLADTLGDVRADRSQVAILKKGVADLRAAARRVPDESAPGQVGEAVDAIQAALTALTGVSDGHDAAVRLFLQGVARGGAHVQALTPTVRDWMRSSGIERSFRIVAGEPASD
jgi:DnaJ-domain-containing protein 1